MITLVLSISALAFVPGPASAAVDQPFGECTEITDVVSAGDGGVLVAGPTGSCSTEFHKSFVAKLNSAGDLDAGFGEGGIVTFPESSSTLLMRMDGSVLVGLPERVVALHPDGDPDLGFGDGGSVPFGLKRLAESASGKIVGGFDDKVWVLEPNGDPDPAFNGGDPVSLGGAEIDGAKIDRFGPLGFAPGGEVLVAVSGKREDPTSTTGFAGALRLEPGGTLDTTYGTDGLASAGAAVDYFKYEPMDLEVLPDGGLRLFGNSTYQFMYAENSQFKLSIDAQGNTDLGKFSFVNASDAATTATGFDSGPDGSVLIGAAQYACRGCGTPPAQSKLAAGMFGSDGQALPEFNDGWPAYQAVGLGSVSGPVALGADGTATVAGFSDSIACGTSENSWRCQKVGSIVRFTPTGSPDPSFGSGGVVTLPACPAELCSTRYVGASPKIRARIHRGELRITVNSRRYLPDTADWFRLRLDLAGARIKPKRAGSIKVLPSGVANYRLNRDSLRSGGKALAIKRVFRQTGNRIEIRIPVSALRREPKTARRKLRLKVEMFSVLRSGMATKSSGTSVRW